MSDAQPEVPVSKEYIAEFVDGPFEGRVEHRVLVDGKTDDEISEMATVGGQDRLFWYVAEGAREVQGVQHVRYRLDARDSDQVHGNDEVDSYRF
ncbi:hypothetical protein [Naasia aerilata]|uniref:DUF3892 domain-containing protein n=1 Tax=Naasia aerilata TaxID=1162966 RepID=A0ABN6XNK7_9MICO|nr:hypothetical protein [Naasia aerilata]BDZ46464.1 hypothetical protein GCM10025866_23730 [Naasia aerilata]